MIYEGVFEDGVVLGRLLGVGALTFCLDESSFCFSELFFLTYSKLDALVFWSCINSLGDTGFLIPEGL